ncbi:hypothetical protein BKI52_14185 [marine bacterium AO1-C]|nr:hypothetical protein BKI52_14185 [marine bacterium AO1-C]
MNNRKFSWFTKLSLVAILSFVAVLNSQAQETVITESNFQVTIPAGWTSSSNEENVITLSKDQGAVSLMVMEVPASEITPANLKQQLGAMYNGIVLKSPNSTNVNGLAGLFVEGNIKGDVPMSVLALTVKKGAKGLVVVGITATVNENTYGNEVGQILKSVTKL